MYGYECIAGIGEPPHFRVHDATDNRVATCYDEDNARMLVNALNNGLDMVEAWATLQGMGVTRGAEAFVSEDYERGYARGIDAARRCFAEALVEARSKPA